MEDMFPPSFFIRLGNTILMKQLSDNSHSFLTYQVYNNTLFFQIFEQKSIKYLEFTKNNVSLSSDLRTIKI